MAWAGDNEQDFSGRKATLGRGSIVSAVFRRGSFGESCADPPGAWGVREEITVGRTLTPV